YTFSNPATFEGQTSPNATVQLVGLNLSTTADGSGNFTFTGVPLTVGSNVLVAQATDVAGNASPFTLTVTLGQRLPPAITAQAVGGAPGQAPAVSGTVRSDSALTSFVAGFDNQLASQYVNVLPNLVSGSFSFDLNRLTQINGAPLSAGAHVLHLI